MSLYGAKGKAGSFVAVAVSLATVCASCLADKGPVGIANLYQVDKLPYIYTGLEARGFSSHDRTGANGDQGNFLAVSGSEYTMMDVSGPGCVYRLWVTGVNSANRIRVYMDGEATARLNKTIAELFTGTTAPFLTPLVGNDNVSSGGFYCYVPMPYRTGCKITIDNSTCYYNITYHQYENAEGVTTFTGSEDVSAVVAQWSNCGTDPKSTPDARTRTGTVAVPASSTVALIDEAGPGSLNRIKFSIPRLDTYDDVSKAILLNARLRIYWDNQTAPLVDAPIGPFFGSFVPGSNVRSLLVGATTPSQFYCYFPMPFGSRAKVEIQNPTAYDIPSLSYDVGIADMADAASKLAAQQIGRFSAAWREEAVTVGRDFPMRSVTGAGVAVGVSINMAGTSADRGYLEGDERIYCDDSLTPAIYGTGTEDFFNGGWYFNKGLFTLPLHGNTAHVVSPVDATACYRLFLGDRIQYKSSLKAGIEHGGVNEKNGTYSCVFYSYDANVPVMTQTDMLDVGDATSEAAHSYTISTQKWSGTSGFFYEGDDDDVRIWDNGRSFSVSCRFTVSINPNNGGVLLRRRTDYSQANQKAYVFVDSSNTGYWYAAGSNTYKNWKDDDYLIPATYTAGKSSIVVRIVYAGGAWWADYRYWVYSLRDTSVTPGTITGNVAVAGGGALAGAHVVATPGGYWGDSDGSGNYAIIGVPPGSYTVTASKFAYASQSQPATVSSGGATTLDFALSPAAAAGSPSEAKYYADGTFVQVNNLIVTAIFDGLGRFYGEKADRSSGIGIEAKGVALGDLVSVTGEAATVNGERVLRNAIVQISAQGQTLPQPVTMIQRALGGGAEGYQGAVINNAAANAYANGRCNIGLLAHIRGNVTYSDAASGMFYLDDGSGIDDGSGHAGVKVDAGLLPVPSVGSQVGVAGVSSAQTIGGKVARVLRPRTIEDIAYPPGDNVLTNPGFETGSQTGWTAINDPGSVVCQSWLASITPHSGSCFNGVAANGATKNGYLYQRVPAVAGRTYQASAWSVVYWGSNEPTAARNRIGIDPTGGIGSPSASTVWSDWDVQPVQWVWEWRPISTSAVAATSYVTVYLENNQQNGLGWHINCLDDVDCHAL